MSRQGQRNTARARGRLLSPLANRRYDEEVFVKDGRYDATTCSSSITEENIIAAYIENNQYQASRIEEFGRG